MEQLKRRSRCPCTDEHPPREYCPQAERVQDTSSTHADEVCASWKTMNDTFPVVSTRTRPCMQHELAAHQIGTAWRLTGPAHGPMGPRRARQPLFNLRSVGRPAAAGSGPSCPHRRTPTLMPCMAKKSGSDINSLCHPRLITSHFATFPPPPPFRTSYISIPKELPKNSLVNC